MSDSSFMGSCSGPSGPHRIAGPSSDLQVSEMPAIWMFDARIWGAHTTGLDALAAGVGLLSAQGSHFASRAGASLLAALGAPHGLATHGLRAYSDALAALLAPAGARAPAWRAARGARRTARRVRPSRIEVTL